MVQLATNYRYVIRILKDKKNKNFEPKHVHCTIFLRNIVSFRSISFRCISILFFSLVQPVHLVICQDILMTCEKHLRDRVISLRRVFWSHKTSLSRPLLNGPNLKSEKVIHIIV